MSVPPKYETRLRKCAREFDREVSQFLEFKMNKDGHEIREMDEIKYRIKKKITCIWNHRLLSPTFVDSLNEPFPKKCRCFYVSAVQVF